MGQFIAGVISSNVQRVSNMKCILFLSLMSAAACQLLPSISPSLKVGTWNLQRFGRAKINNETICGYIRQVIAEYDLIVLLEVTDSSEQAIPTLLSKLSVTDQDWAYELSPRIGRTSYKEQYAFMYKKSRVSVVSSYQYPDTEDAFQVEPYITIFRSTSVQNLDQFAVIPLHAKPADAAKEIGHLLHVYEDVLSKTEVKDAIILGDLNAGCTYLGQSDIDVMRLANDQRFQWLISDHADTTTKYTTCPYDRIIVAGDAMKAAVIDGSAKPFYFDEVYGMHADYDLVEDISDHYPVGVELRGAIPPIVGNSDEAGSLRKLLSVEVGLPSTSAAWNRVMELVEDENVCSTETCVRTMGISTSSSSRGTYTFAIAEWEMVGASDVSSFIRQLHTLYPEIFTAPAAAILLDHLREAAHRHQEAAVQEAAASQTHVGATCHRRRGEGAQCHFTVGVPTPL